MMIMVMIMMTMMMVMLMIDGDDDDEANISVIHTYTSLLTYTCDYSGYIASCILGYLNITLHL